MNGWPSISRARVIRYNLIFGLLCLAFVAVYVVLSLAGVGGSPDDLHWVTVAVFGGLGILALIGVWAMHRDQANEDAAVDRTSFE
jgi:hypothetical protein